MKKKSFITALVALSLISSSLAFAGTATGTILPWSATLPHSNGNIYFNDRVKATAEKVVDFKVIKMGTSQVNAWTCDTANTVISNIVRDTSINVEYPMALTSNSAKGSSVHVGLENNTSTTVFHDDANGTVNYH